jgi:hypothetical protein
LVTGADPLANEGEDLRCGNENIIIVLSDYNGGPEDDSVNVFATPSYGIHNLASDASLPTDPECGVTRADNPALNWPARRDGTDLWSLTDPLFVEVAQGNPPAGVSVNTITGYVTKGQLVVDARGFGFLLPVSFQGQIIHLSTPTLTADVHVDGGKVYLDNGIASGRISATEVLTAIQTIFSNQTGSGCNAATFTSLLLPQLCRGRDIRSTPSDDFRTDVDGGLLPCDAFSAAVGFTAIPTMVDPQTASPPDSGCSTIPSCPN